MLPPDQLPIFLLICTQVPFPTCEVTLTSSINASIKVKPIPEVEREIAELWKEMLSVEDIGRNDNFFEIGGDSLLATQFVECLKQKYEIEMSLREIFNNAELDRVSKIIEEKIECNKQMIEGEI